MPVSDLLALAASSNISYVFIFLAIVLSGHLVPLPEDAVLFFAGYVAALQHTALSFSILWAICLVGPFCADALLFYVALAHGKYAKWFLPHIKTGVFERISHELHENTMRTVIAARFIPGVRLASPLVAGTINVRKRAFLAASLIGSVIYGSLFFFLGYVFHEYLPQFFHIARVGRHLLFFLIPLALILVIAFYMNQKVKVSE